MLHRFDVSPMIEGGSCPEEQSCVEADQLRSTDELQWVCLGFILSLEDKAGELR